MVISMWFKVGRLILFCCECAPFFQPPTLILLFRFASNYPHSLLILVFKNLNHTFHMLKNSYLIKQEIEQREKDFPFSDFIGRAFVCQVFMSV